MRRQVLEASGGWKKGSEPASALGAAVREERAGHGAGGAGPRGPGEAHLG